MRKLLIFGIIVAILVLFAIWQYSSTPKTANKVFIPKTTINELEKNNVFCWKIKAQKIANKTITINETIYLKNNSYVIIKGNSSETTYDYQIIINNNQAYFYDQLKGCWIKTTIANSINEYEFSNKTLVKNIYDQELIGYKCVIKPQPLPTITKICDAYE